MSSSEVETNRGEASSKEIRRTRVRALIRRLTVWVALPTMLGIIYFGFLAAPQFDSISLLSVQSSKDAKVVIAKRDSKAVEEYMLSRGMLQLLSAQDSWPEHYTKSGDRWTNLDHNAGPEEQYRYFQSKTKVRYIDSTGSLELRVRAFSGESAQSFATAIIVAAEQMLAKQFAELVATDLVVAEQQAKDAALALARADEVLATKMQEQVATHDQGAGAAGVEAARFQVDLGRKRLEELLVARDSAQLRSMEGKQRLVVISAPSQPRQAAHPRRLWGMLTVFVLSLVGMAVFTMLAAAVREHARF